jgi:23S rRNA pseudouridine2605 synthase
MPAERLQKLLAAAGYGSRRACEDFLTAGRVRVNGSIAKLGDKADPALDKIAVDGEPLVVEKQVYIMLNKPRNVVSSLEAQGDRDTVRDLVKVPGRLYPVGRLDAQSEGLILLTNDGELTNRLTHPRYGHEKEYSVFIVGELDYQRLDAWRRGIVIRDEDGNGERTAPAQVAIDKRTGEGTWLTVIMREGKKHQIRRVAETLGLAVARLIRVRMGALELGTLASGTWRALSAAEVKALQGTAPAPRAKSRPRAGATSSRRNTPPARPDSRSKRPGTGGSRGEESPRPSPRNKRPASGGTRGGPTGRPDRGTKPSSPRSDSRGRSGPGPGRNRKP